MSRDYAVALANYMLAHVKLHAQYCGGSSTAIALDHNGDVEEFNSEHLEQLALHTEAVAGWFVCEAQEFMETFERRLEQLKERALHMRNVWESRIAAQTKPHQTEHQAINLPPWPDSC
jgi:hypothetical protein